MITPAINGLTTEPPQADTTLSNAEIKEKLKQLIGHQYICITTRGDAAIKAALELFDNVLIPEEGGWLSYKKLPKHYELVGCDDSKINLADLKNKLKIAANKSESAKKSESAARTKPVQAFLYQNPGGYFAEQPAKEIYELCSRHDCKVIMDVSGSIGTDLCQGNYADILVGSFGKWKLVDAGKGGFISCSDKMLFEQLKITPLVDETILQEIKERLNHLNPRIKFLSDKRKKIINDLKNFKVLYPQDTGFVVVVLFNDEAGEFNNKTKKENNEINTHFKFHPGENNETNRLKLSPSESLINYCAKNKLEWTECPRYIRINKKAISIEIKRL